MLHKNKILTILFSILLSACTIYPPPRIENQTYIYPEYDFKIDIPEGWNLTKSVPKEFTEGLSLFERNRLKFILTNIYAEGLIICLSNKANLALWQIALDSKALEKTWTKYYDEGKIKIEKDPNISDYKYEYYIPNYFKCRKSFCFAVKETWKVAGDYKVIRKTYLHDCFENKTCEIAFFLLSKSIKYDQNFETLEKVVTSLRAVNEE